MQEIMHLQLTRETLLALQADAADKTRQLLSELQNHERAVANFIVAYYFNERRWVYDVEIEPASLVVNTHGEGRFKVRYKLGAVYGDTGQPGDQTDEMIVLLNISFVDEKLTLTGEERPGQA